MTVSAASIPAARRTTRVPHSCVFRSSCIAFNVVMIAQTRHTS